MLRKPVIRIGVFLPAGGEFPPRLLTGIHQFADEFPDVEFTERLYRESIDNPLDNFTQEIDSVITWADRSNPWVAEAAQRGIPVFNCSLDWSGYPGVTSIGLDPEALSDLIVEQFAHAKVAALGVIGIELTQREHTARICRRILDKAKAVFPSAALLDLAGPHPTDHRNRMVEVEEERELLEFLRALPKPCGVWCENDNVARMVCNAAAHLDFAVPEVLAVLGAGDYRIAAQGQPTISTIPRPGEKIGYLAAKYSHQHALGQRDFPAETLLAPDPITVRRSTGTPNRVSQVVSDAKQIIEKEACTGLSVEELCRRLEVSKTTLTERFEQVFGDSPGAHIRRVRITLAQRLLRETHQTISEIGRAIGFDESSKFAHFFRRETQLSPGDYRRQR